MGIADILDETVELYKTSFALLMGIAAVLYVPYSVFTQYFTMKYAPSFDLSNPKPMDSKHMLAYFGAVVVGIIWMLVVSPFVTGALTYAVSERFLSNKVTVASSFRRLMNGRIFGGLVVYVLISFAISLAMIGVITGAVIACVFVGYANTALLFAAVPVALLVVLGAIFGGVYLMLRIALVDCILVVEYKGIGESLGRGWNLIKGSMLKCFGLLLLTTVVVGIVQSIAVQPTAVMVSFSQLKGGHPSELLLAIHTLVAALSSTLLAPVTSIVTILLYYDIRIRKEGFDLELLAAELHANQKQSPALAGQPLPQEQVTAPPQETPPPPPEEGPTPQ